jgi:hypothetical protein
MKVYVIDNACTKIVHHFREERHQMELKDGDELWAGRKARYNSATKVELTRDDRKWKEMINKLDARGKARART